MTNNLLPVVVGGLLRGKEWSFFVDCPL